MTMDDLDTLYGEIILDHFRHPRNTTTVEHYDMWAEGYNPFCGDQVIFSAALDSTARFEKIGCHGQGCAISQASASMMSEILKGKTIDEAKALLQRFRSALRGEVFTEEEEEALGELVALQDVRRFPIRIKCALLAWSTLQDAMDQPITS